MIALIRTQRCYYILAAAGLAVTTSLTGCCKDSDKEALKEMVDRAIDRNFKACEPLTNQTLLAQCIENAQNQQSLLITAYSNYLAACATGKREAIEDALDRLEELLRPKNKAISTPIGVVNEEVVLTKDESVCLAITMSSSGIATPQDFVAINQTKYLPEAAGAALIEASSDNDAAPVVVVENGDLAANASHSFSIGSGSSVCVNSSGMSLTGSVSGSFSFSSAAVAQTEGLANGHTRLIPTDAAMTITVLGTSFTMTLDRTCPYNELVVDANGNGTLSFRANFKSSGTVPLPSRLPEAAWIVIPIWRSADGTQLVANTGATVLTGLQLFPTLPNPIADVNRDLVVDNADYSFFMTAYQTGHPWADVNHDGVIDTLDMDLFLDRWTAWSQP